MAGELSFGDKQGEGNQNHRERREADGQQVHGKSGQHDEDHADGAGHDRAGVVEFDIQTQGANQQNDQRDIRIHDVGKDVLLQRHLVVAHGLVRLD